MKKNKKEINIEVLAVNIFICLLLVSLVVVLFYYFLVFRTTTPVSKIWNIHFSRIINKECGYDTVCTTPTIYTDSTTTGDYTVEFSQANQKAVYEITVVNEGYVDAEITNIILGSPHCKGNSEDSFNAFNDASNVCEKLNYVLLDEDNNKVVPGNIVKAGTSHTYQLVLSYNDNYYYVSEDSRLSDSVTVRNLNLTIDYNQVR
jgi:sulfur relay (sulfurtransferase) DsrF/TusC family protein